MNARGHLSSETIDLLLLSALNADETNQAKQHLDACGECKQRWQELNDDKQRFEQYVFARTLPAVEARVAKERGGFFQRFKFAFLVPVAGLAAAFAVVAATGPGTQTEDDLYVGIKGQPTLELYAQRGDGGSFAVASGVALQPSDRLRFVVNPAGSKYVIVASHDGDGVFSVYHPFGAQVSLPVADPKAKLELPGAVELDNTLGTERVVAVFSDEPLTAAQVEAALKSDAKNPSLKGARFVAREFRKVAP